MTLEAIRLRGGNTVLFPVGKVRWSKELLAHPGIAQDDLIDAFDKYIRGDWGEVSSNRSILNDLALTGGEETIGRYVSRAGVPFLITTGVAGTRIVLAETSPAPRAESAWYVEEGRRDL